MIGPNKKDEGLERRGKAIALSLKRNVVGWATSKHAGWVA